jgi:hypothetical protein
MNTKLGSNFEERNCVIEVKAKMMQECMTYATGLDTDLSPTENFLLTIAKSAGTLITLTQGVFMMDYSLVMENVIGFVGDVEEAVGHASEWAAQTKDVLDVDETLGAPENDKVKESQVSENDLKTKINWIDEILYIISFLKTDMGIVRQMLIKRKIEGGKATVKKNDLWKSDHGVEILIFVCDYLFNTLRDRNEKNYVKWRALDFMRDLYYAFDCKKVKIYIADCLQTIAQSTEGMGDLYISSLKSKAGEIVDALRPTQVPNPFPFLHKDQPDASTNNELRKLAFNKALPTDHFIAYLNYECVDLYMKDGRANLLATGEGDPHSVD